MQSLWDRITATPEQVPVPDWHREVLDERLKDYEANPDAGESWDVMRERLRDKLRPRWKQKIGAPSRFGRCDWRTIEFVRFRYYLDPATGQPHIYQHNVQENEVEEVLARPIEDRVGSEGSRVALGQTEGGRYLRVIYVPDPEPESAFVITAYDLGAKALKALRRRRRRKK